MECEQQKPPQYLGAKILENGKFRPGRGLVKVEGTDVVLDAGGPPPVLEPLAERLVSMPTRPATGEKRKRE